MFPYGKYHPLKSALECENIRLSVWWSVWRLFRHNCCTRGNRKLLARGKHQWAEICVFVWYIETMREVKHSFTISPKTMRCCWVNVKAGMLQPHRSSSLRILLHLVHISRVLSHPHAFCYFVKLFSFRIANYKWSKACKQKAQGLTSSMFTGHF